MRTTFVLALLAGGLAQAQTTTTLFGTITDKTGAAVPAAHVAAVNVGTNQAWNGQTNTQGEYRIEFLPAGEYTVEVTASGFKKSLQKGVVLQISVPARVDAQLDVGQLTESVEVAATAPTVNTEDAQIGRTVENTEITTLPIVGRNVYTLLSLTPGVSSSSSSIVLGYPEQRTMINGGVDGGAGSVNYYLDGGNNMTGLRNTGNIAPNPDAVDEFRVITNSYSAEYGKFAGGVINIITRSGSNTFHGSAFEFLRNTDLNAYDWGALTKPTMHRNQFGAPERQRALPGRHRSFQPLRPRGVEDPQPVRPRSQHYGQRLAGFRAQSLQHRRSPGEDRPHAHRHSTAERQLL
jgi:hypothetical protein